MKRIIALIFVTLIASQVGAIDLGKKLALRLVNFPLNPAMDTGVYNAIKWPDSATIAVWATTGADTGAATSQVIYGTSTTTVTAAGLAALGIRADTVGAPMFVFCDTARIINAGTTTRQIAGVVTLWRLGAPFQTQFSMEIYADTLIDEVKTVAGTSQTAKDLGATTQTILDTLQVYDNATRFQADVQEILDTLQTYDAAGRFQADAQEILDSIQLYDNWVRDSIHNAVIYARISADSIQVYDNAGRFQADVQEILDTLQTYDNATRFQLVVQELLDTLKTYDNTGRFQLVVQEILDTLQNVNSSLRVDTNTTWTVAQRDTMLNRSLVTKDSTYAILDTLQNGSSTLRASGSGATAAQVKAALFADTSKYIGFAGGSGDSVKAVAATTFDTTLLDKVRDTVNVILDSIQNAASTLRSVHDTDYLQVACGDTLPLTNISNRLDSLAAAVMAQLGFPSTGNAKITLGVAKFAINSSVPEICRELPAVEKYDTVIMTSTGEGVALNADFLRIHSLKKMGKDSLRIPLIYVSEDSLFDLSGGMGGVLQKRGDASSPRYYFTFGRRLQTHPKEIAVDTFLVEYYANGHYMTNDADSTDIAREYRQLLIYKACQKCEIIMSNWTNVEGYGKLYEREVAAIRARGQELKK